jgi:hypothetical protein
MQTETKGGLRTPGAALLAAVLTALLGGEPARAALQAPVQAAESVDPSALPAHDSHQGLLIAADPYLSNERSRQRFGKKHPYGAGLLALEVFLRNDTDGPIQIQLDSMELKVAPPGRPTERLAPLTVREAALRIILPLEPNPKTQNGPIPEIDLRVDKNKDVTKMEKSLRTEILSGDRIGPHSTLHGFLLFDLGHQFEQVRNASLYVPDVCRAASGERLLFFEVHLGSAVH